MNLQPAVVVLARSDDTGLLMAISRSRYPRDLGLPGARIFWGEDVYDAARRGLRDDVGCELIDYDVVWKGIAGQQSSGRLVFVLRARVWRGIPEAKKPGTRFVWASPVDLEGVECSHRGFYSHLFERLREMKVYP